MPTNKHQLLLDTHVWIHFVLGDGALSKAAISLIRDATVDKRVCISVISLWELGMLVSHKRIVLGSPPIEWAHKGLRDLSASLVDITGDIAIESSFLPGDFHGDPADRILVATARSKGLILLTKDKAILRYSSAHFVQTIAA